MDHVRRVESASPSETEALGFAWGRELAASGRNWLVGLSGDLGAGKTQLTRGLCNGLGYSDRISSPTYGLINEYRPDPPRLVHLDLYRLDGPEQIVGAGLEDCLVWPDGIVIVEWIERWWPWVPTLQVPAASGFSACTRVVRIEATSETDRSIQYVDLGL